MIHGLKIFACWVFLMGSLLAQEAAQSVLPEQRLQIGSKQVVVEIADDDSERSSGLMFRDSLRPDHGMLFVMPEADRVMFWMKNTKIPLSIAYISAAGVILEIHDMQPLDETPVPSSFPAISYALEMEQGWFSKNGVFAGDGISGLPRFKK